MPTKQNQSILPPILTSDRGAALWRIALDLMTSHRYYTLRGKPQRKESKARIIDARSLCLSQQQIDFHCEAQQKTDDRHGQNMSIVGLAQTNSGR